MCLKTTKIYRDMEKGKTNNPNGRPKGKPNKVTQEVRAWLSTVIDKNRKQMEKDLKALEPKDRLQILEKLMQYVVPKQQTTAVELDGRLDKGEYDLSTLTDDELTLYAKLLEKMTKNEQNDTAD